MTPVELDVRAALAIVGVVFTGIFVALPGLYLGMLSVLSFFGPRGSSPATEHRFAVLIPAHDEERTIARLLLALRDQDYPSQLVTVHVVADNCTDRTALVARANGANTYERDEPARRGKGAALNWLLGRVLADEAPDAVVFDAVVFLDADARPEPSFLGALSGELQRGASILQGLNLVEATSDRPLVTLRVISFHLRCQLRPAAYTALGVSAGLFGVGMCFRRDLLHPALWDESSVAEDVTLHLRIVQDGGRAVFAPRAVVHTLMPSGLGEAVGQQTRWERGKLDLLRAAAPLALRSLRRGHRAGLVAAIEVFVPPTALIGAAGLIALAIGLLTDLVPLALAAAVGIGGLALYVTTGIVLSRIPPGRLGRALAFLPVFGVWHLFVIARVALGAGKGDWRRASRASVPAASGSIARTE